MDSRVVMSAYPPQSLSDVVDRCQQVMANAWMVRTFIKHCEEVEDFPELMGIVRAVFDTSRALETRVDDPTGYLKMLRKKIGKLKTAARRFEEDAAEASTHTNFQQAVIGMHFCNQQLEELLEVGQTLISGSSPPN